MEQVLALVLVVEDMLRRIALLASLAVIAGSAVSGAAEAGPADDACEASPTAVPCVFAEKAVEAQRTLCRSQGGPEAACKAVPFGRDAGAAAVAAHQGSWLQRTAEFQYALGNPVPLRDAQWIGTHNSFNATANGMTVSHSDSNQQLTLTQQLDSDVRSLELDLHFVRGEVRVCHARPASEQHAGCSTERTFAQVLPELASWTAAHPDQVLLLYLEDALKEAAGYSAATTALDNALGSRIYRPATPSAGAACTQLPLGASRQDVLDAGKSVVVVGDCAAGWSAYVYGWKGNTSTESGNSTGYTCTSPISADKYQTQLVRFFEDSTFLSSVTAPQQSMAARRAGALTPEKVTAMMACGVNLFGFDQYEPGDGRLAASIWSWAPGQPDASAGSCTIQRPDGRWYSAACDGTRLQAAAPRTGEENAALRALAAGRDVQLTLPQL